MLILPGLVLCLFGAVFIFAGLYNLVMVKNTKTEETSGTIIDTCIDPRKYNDDAVGDRQSVIGFGYSSSFPIVEYTVNGQKYIRADSIGQDYVELRKMLGEVVPVFYDPDEPKVFSLTRKNTTRLAGFMILVIGLVVFGMGYLFINPTALSS